MKAVLGKTRDEIREEWKEFNYIVRRCNELGFDYVQLPQSLRPQKLCFGTELSREVLPVSGKSLSSFMRAHTIEPNDRIGPGVYYSHRNRPLQVPNPVCFHSKTARFPVPWKPKYLNDDFYNVDPQKPVRTDKKPFGIGDMVKRCVISSSVPGVGTYNLSPKRKYFFRHSFGGKITPISLVHTICTPQNLDRCQVCEEDDDQLSRPPLVDYWKNLKTGVVYCRSCMRAKKKEAIERSKTKFIKIKRLMELRNDFTLVRNCQFYHQHENTTAKVCLISPEEIRKKYRREHYLSQFKFKLD